MAFSQKPTGEITNFSENIVLHHKVVETGQEDAVAVGIEPKLTQHQHPDLGEARGEITDFAILCGFFQLHDPGNDFKAADVGEKLVKSFKRIVATPHLYPFSLEISRIKKSNGQNKFHDNFSQINQSMGRAVLHMRSLLEESASTSTKITENGSDEKRNGPDGQSAWARKWA